MLKALIFKADAKILALRARPNSIGKMYIFGLNERLEDYGKEEMHACTSRADV